MSADGRGEGRDYAVDVAYPGRFHRETMPGWLHAVAIALGRRAPDPARAFRQAELGCGDGLNLVVAAALHPHGEFVGLDLDPAHIAAARALAAAVGLDNVRFVHGDVADPSAALARGSFDFVVSHGMWSWIADATRQAATALAVDLLRPGGLAMVSYMSHPGASVLAALQRLLREYAAGCAGDAGERAAQALAFARRLAAAGAGLFAEHPGLARQLQAMMAESPQQLAHEFLAGHWQPLHAAEVMRAFADADAEWIGSATPIENIDALSVPGNALPLLREATTPALAETVRDAARHQSLRRDLFQRGGAALDTTAHLAALDALTWIAAPGSPPAGGLVLDTRIGPVQVPAELCGPLLRRLAQGPATHAELRRLAPFAQRPDVLNQVTQALLWAGSIHPQAAAADGSGANAALQRCLDARPAPRWRPWPQAGSALPQPAVPPHSP